MTDLSGNHSPFFTRKRVRSAGVLLAGVLAAAVFTGSATTKTTYVISHGDLITTVEGYTGELDSALRRAGIPVDPTDRVEHTRQGDISLVSILPAQTVTVSRDGSETRLLAYEETIGDLLVRINVALGPEDTVSQDLDALAADGMTVEVDRRFATTSTVSSPIPYETLRQENQDLYQGEELVTQVGQEGRLDQRTRVVYSLSGHVAETMDLGRTVARGPQPEIVEYGTKLKPVSPSYLSVTSDVLTNVTGDVSTGGVLTTASGKELSYSRAIGAVATAYTTERQSWKITATGTTARVGAIAVDPRVIPYGTRMYIVSADGSITYGVATAEDCGGSIKGNRVDLFFNTYDECINFGVRDCVVYILE